MRIVGTAIALLLLAACGPSDPASRSAPTYVAQIEPLLYENGLLAERMLMAAALVHEDEKATAKAIEAWKEEIVPLSRHLADQAAITVVPIEWNERHGELVAAWSSRAEAYAEIQSAMEQGDSGLWRAGRRKSDQSKLDEEEWFRRMNEELAPLGLAVDQFP